MQCCLFLAEMMEEDEQENTAGPSTASASARTSCTGPLAASQQTTGAGSLTASQKTTMGMVLKGMFLEGGAHSVKLAQLVEQYNKTASRPASAEQIDEVCIFACAPNMDVAVAVSNGTVKAFPLMRLEAIHSCCRRLYDRTTVKS